MSQNRTLLPAVTLAAHVNAGGTGGYLQQVAPANDPLYLNKCDGCPFTGGSGRLLSRECLELCINGFRLLGGEEVFKRDGRAVQSHLPILNG